MTRKSESRSVPRRSEWLVRHFCNYILGYVGKRIHAVRVARSNPLPALTDGPLIVVLNHPSWWDPLIGTVVLTRLDGRRHYGPIDAKALTRYPVLERLGFFGVDTGSASGARAFLRQASAILEDPKAVLWITAQGEFTDPRRRPVRFKQGVGHLVHRMRNVTVWTMALEYPFWEERTPEALVAFGPPIVVEDGSALAPAEWTARIESALESTQDQLAEAAISRDPARFETFVSGKAGVGGLYDLWRRFIAMIQGKKFVAEHGAAVVEMKEVSSK